MAERQEMQSASESRPRSRLLFVNVAVASSRTHFPSRRAEEERNVRAHVMRDHLQRKAEPLKHLTPSPAPSNLSNHLTRFRLSSRQDRKRSHRKLKEVSASGEQKMPAILPKARQNLCGVVLAEPRANDIFRNVLSPIDTSTLDTSALLEYYHTSFYDNSLSCNPEGQWLSVAFSDAAILHATLCLVALHKGGGRESNCYFWHRGEAMHLISKNLGNPRQAISDANIAAVAVLAASDDSMHWPLTTQKSHIEGLTVLVRLRGGLEGIHDNRHIQRVVVWADVLHAATHNSVPQLGIFRQFAHQDLKRLLDTVKPYRHLRAKRHIVVPAYFLKILGNLQALNLAKSILGDGTAVSRARELRELFSDILFVTEYLILELGNTPHPSYTEWGISISVEAVKAAALIFAFHGLQDMAIPAAFFDRLIQRLRDGLYVAYDYISPNQIPILISDEQVAAAFPLWLCLNGWIACAVETRRPDREYFVEKAATICESAGIGTQDMFTSCISQVDCSTEYYLFCCSGFWASIETRTASHGLEQITT